MCYHTASVTRERRPVFSIVENAELLLEAINYVRNSDKAHVLAFAIMMDHMHLLLVPKDEHSLSDIMKAIKNYSATMINRRMGTKGALWQQSFYDRVVRSERHLTKTIEYIHRNPVVAGLATELGDYRFASDHPVTSVDLEAFLDG